MSDKVLKVLERTINVIKFLLVAGIMFFIIVIGITKAAGAEGGYIWIVDAPQGVNVRDAKSGGEVIGLLRKGECFHVVKEEGDWIATIYGEQDGELGWIYKSNCHIAHAEEIEEWENRKKNGIKVTNDDAYLIGETSEDCIVYKTANGTKLGTIEAGSQVFIRQTGKWWYKIIWQNKEIAYVQASKVSLKDINVPGNGEIRVTGNKTVVVKDSPMGEKIAKLKPKTFVRLLDETDDSGYLLVSFGTEGVQGYVKKNELKTTKIFD